jgi:hypothetical protein
MPVGQPSIEPGFVIVSFVVAELAQIVGLRRW